ncbi:Smr/MutS family protein [Winogradskyella sp. 3972H.M.0a.05]|uniref:Smr/MutS family protein n=1 Tax=Winogradskyella sp. 3972H.M.0a.05 TaxID=2950277 RepID=UPI0033944911
MRAFKVGDRVSVIDENISGVVSRIDGNTIYIESEDGFEFSYQANDLVLDKASDISTSIFSHANSEQVIQEKETDRKPKSKKSKPKERSKPSLVVDLHIEKLVDSTRNMTNYDIITLQLDTVRRQLEFAMRKRIQKVVFIHGVGEGVLKMEMETVLRRYDNLKYYDADYREYGYGATEVYIFQNVRD